MTLSSKGFHLTSVMGPRCPQTRGAFMSARPTYTHIHKNTSGISRCHQVCQSTSCLHAITVATSNVTSHVVNDIHSVQFKTVIELLCFTIFSTQIILQIIVNLHCFQKYAVSQLPVSPSSGLQTNIIVLNSEHCYISL